MSVKRMIIWAAGMTPKNEKMSRETEKDTKKYWDHRDHFTSKIDERSEETYSDKDFMKDHPLQLV